jgi:hypothetical protein
MPSPSPELLLSLSPSVLRALVATFGPLPGSRPSAPLLSIVRAIFEERAGAKLARVLGSVVARFSTETARRAIVEGGRARRDARAGEWLEVPAADVAAKLAIESATEKGRAKRATERVLSLAGLRLERELAERPTYELLAARAVAGEGAALAIERALGALVHDVWTHAEEDGGTRLAVFTRLPTATRLVLEGEEIATRVDLPIAVDRLHVHPGGTRVSFTLATPELLPVYATALGLSLRPSLTLRPLHDLTAERLARIPLPRGVHSVTVVAIRRRRPDGSRHEIRALNALDPVHDGTAGRTGYVDRATLRVMIGDRAIDVFLQLPHRIEISDLAFEGPVREVLAAIGLFDPGALPDDARSLAPYEHGDWRWRSVVGDAGFDALVAAKILVRVIAAHVATEEHRMHGAGYVVRDVPGESGVQYALAEDRSLGARIVGKEDRVAWRLDRAALAAAMRADLGATAVGKPGAIEVDAVIDLGVVTLASGKLRFVYAMGAPAKGWLTAIVRGCGIGVTPVVMVPRGHAGDVEGVIAIELDVEEQLGVKRIGRVLGRAAEALGVTAEVEPWRLCEEEVVVEGAAGGGARRVWVIGVAINGLSERGYRFVEYLAKNAGRVIATKELGGYVSNAGAPDVTARKVKREVEERVKGSLEAAGVAAERVAGGGEEDDRRGWEEGVSARDGGEGGLRRET